MRSAGGAGGPPPPPRGLVPASVDAADGSESSLRVSGPWPSGPPDVADRGRVDRSD